MKLVKKHTHRGVVGVESAIVMIAFVIVAAALAFVVLNMGFSTSQQAKTTIVSGLEEASSSLMISATITAEGDEAGSPPVLKAIMIPLKVGSGGNSVNLEEALTLVRYLSNTVEYADIYTGPLTTKVYKNPTDAFDDAVIAGLIDTNPITGAAPTDTTAIIYWSVMSTPFNSVMESGEHAILAIAWNAADQPVALDTIQAEIISAGGAPLSVERKVPQITTSVTDLG